MSNQQDRFNEKQKESIRRGQGQNIIKSTQAMFQVMGQMAKSN